VSRHDGEADSRLEELLATSEKMEAEALRAELQAFLRSAEARREIEQIVLKPVESAITSAMQSVALQEQIRAQVLAALTPQLAPIAKAAVTNALRDVQVTLDDKVKDALRTRAEKVLRDAFEEAETQAFNSLLPRLVEGTRKHVKGELEKAARGAEAEVKGGNQAQGDRPIVTGRKGWRRWGPEVSLMMVAVLIVIGVLYLVFIRRPEPAIDNPDQYDASVTSNTATQSSRAAAQTANPPVLYGFYLDALAKARPENLPPVTKEQKQCLENSIRAWELGGNNLDLSELRSSLGECKAITEKPAGAARIVAIVQEQLNDEATKQTCGTLPRVVVDGVHGQGTKNALQKYVECTAPRGLTSSLDTLADYATVGVYFVNKREIKHE
jgi:hypothetical protein